MALILLLNCCLINGCISHGASCFKWPNPQVKQLKWTTGNLSAHITHLMKGGSGPTLWAWGQGLRPLWFNVLPLESSCQFPSLRSFSPRGKSPRGCDSSLELMPREGKRFSHWNLNLKTPHGNWTAPMWITRPLLGLVTWARVGKPRQKNPIPDSDVQRIHSAVRRGRGLDG